LSSVFFFAVFFTAFFAVFLAISSPFNPVLPQVSFWTIIVPSPNYVKYQNIMETLPRSS
jgi:hypothetical protein